MANVVTTQIINDGPRNAVIKFTNLSDGTPEVAVKKVDVSTLSANGRNGVPTSVRINKIDVMTSGMGVNILWDATADVVALTLAQEENYSNDFSDVGGIPNNAGAGKTGDINFTTVGATSGDSYTIILHLVKKYD